jgi:uncharacterized phiE125 gp8 family phage protein
MGRTLVTGPLRLPLDVEETKDFLVETGADQEGVIGRLIQAAVKYAEERTARKFIAQIWDITYDRFPAWNGELLLPFAPLSSVTSISYNDPDGTPTVLASTSYTVDAGALSPRIVPTFNENWPDTRGHINDVTVRAVFGYGVEPEDVPEEIKLPLLQVVMHLYEHRSAGVVGSTGIVGFEGAVPALDAILGPLRLRRAWLV